MKRLIVISALMAVALLAPLAQAQSCSGYTCRVGSCPWYELLIDGSFTSPSCHAWSYTGGASLSNGSICNWTNTAYGLLEYNSTFTHTSSLYQILTTRSGATDLDNFTLQYIMEITDLTPGDIVKVTIRDITTGVTITTDTFTADTWCNSVEHTYNSAGWKGHTLQLKWAGTFANPVTAAKITNATFWQQFQ